MLLQQNMEALFSLDKSTDEIIDEAIQYSSCTSDKTQKEDDLISELEKLLENEKKRQNEIKLENIALKEEFIKISKEYKEYQNKFEEINKKWSNHINDFETKLKEIIKKFDE